MHRAARSQADARHERAATAAAARPGGPPGPECQPNAGAPLLRDERARREWLEHELGLACQARGPPVAPRAARPPRRRGRRGWLHKPVRSSSACWAATLRTKPVSPFIGASSDSTLHAAVLETLAARGRRPHAPSRILGDTARAPSHRCKWAGKVPRGRAAPLAGRAGCAHYRAGAWGAATPSLRPARAPSGRLTRGVPCLRPARAHAAVVRAAARAGGRDGAARGGRAAPGGPAARGRARQVHVHQRRRRAGRADQAAQRAGAPVGRAAPVPAARRAVHQRRRAIECVTRAPVLCSADCMCAFACRAL